LKYECECVIPPIAKYAMDGAPGIKNFCQALYARAIFSKIFPQDSSYK
jgi:hypothetical protein